MFHLVLTALVLVISLLSLFLYDMTIEFHLLIGVLSFKLDYFSKLMTFTFLIILLVVIVWSNFYMISETKFVHLLYSTLLFGSTMLVFIFANNPFTCIVGWDGLGVTSFLLIIFYNNWDVKHSGMFVLMTNKLGDCFLMFTIASLVWIPSLDIGIFTSTLSCLLLLLSNCTKSAHLPFSEWLPLSMSAPTTISALVHSSTLVCAGIILQIKFEFYEMSNLGCMINLLTAAYAGLMALNEKDLKKLVAFSTMSQTAFMSILLTLDLKEILILHMISHAFFKSSMFIQVGNNMHSNFNLQNLTQFNSSAHHNLSNSAGLLLNNMALLGLTFSSGFLAKDIILEKFLTSSVSCVLLFISLSIFLLTIIYAIAIFKTILVPSVSPFKTLTFSFISTLSWTLLSILGVVSAVILMNNNLIFQNSLSIKFLIFMGISLLLLVSIFKNMSFNLKHASNSNILLLTSSWLSMGLANSSKLYDTMYDLGFKQIFGISVMSSIFLIKSSLKLTPSIWGVLIFLSCIFLFL